MFFKHLKCHSLQKKIQFIPIAVLFLIFQSFNSASDVTAQTINDKVTFELNGGSLEQGLQILAKSTKFHLSYAIPVVAKYKDITVSRGTRTIAQTLNLLLSNTDLKYVVKRKNILIIEKGNTKSVSQSAPEVGTPGSVSGMYETGSKTGKKHQIRGVVYDSHKDALPGVNVWVKGTNIGATTDANGNFVINLPEIDKVDLVFTFVGMEDKTIHYKGQDRLAVTMVENLNELDELKVVSTGMFTRKAESFTGAVVTYNKDQLKRVGNQNLIASLKNLDPSFVINENLTAGSNPNQLPDVQMRGQNSLPDLKGEYQTAPNQPLFILDGFETTIEKIYDMDMNLVASITLLKDAAAKAIYGSKAANGVVVIETVQPQKGRLRFSYNGSMDLEVADLSSYNLTNSSEKLQAEVLAGKYTSTDAYTQAGLTQTYNNLNNEIARGVDTYWLSKPIHTGVGTKHSLYMDGGDDTMRYSANISYNKVTGVMKGSDRSTVSGNLMLSYRYKTLAFRNSLSIDDNKSKNSPYGSFSDYATMLPYYRVNDANGNLIKSYGNNDYNPLYNASLKSIDETAYTTITENFYGEWTAIKNLRLTARLGYTKSLSSSDYFVSADNTRYASITPSSDEYLKRGSYTQGHGKTHTLSSDLGVSYALDMDKNLLYANLLYNISETTAENSSMTAIGFPSDKMNYISFGNAYETDGKPSGSESKSRSLGVTGALNYSYDNRYLLDFSYRLNASSMFGSKNRWGNFWSAGIGWNLHNEAFIKQLGWIEYAKLRASLGYTGSQNFSTYQAISTYNYITDKTYNGDMGIQLMGLANDNLKWQQQYDENIGLDLTLFKTLSIRTDYYVSKAKSLLSDVSLAPSAGFSTYKENLGETQNKGIEVACNWRAWSDPKSRSSVNLFFNIAHNKNKITKISNALEQVNKAQDDIKNTYTTDQTTLAAIRKPSTRFEEGQSMTAIWAVRSEGIDPITGKEVFLKKDGTTTYTWSTDDQVVCGDATPKVQGNVGANILFKGFEANFSFNYRFGGQTYNSTLVEKVENVDVLNDNVDKRVLTDRWNTPGVPAKFKGIADYTTTKPTSRFVEDLNELTLSSISLGYDFSRMKFLKRSFLEYLKVTFNMNDVAYISSVKKERGTSYPFARTFSFGLQARF
jgi:TonB-linked SusC/RagA family outer membrane protein